MNKEGEKMLTKQDVMERLNVSLGTVNKLIREKKLPVYKIDRAVRIQPKDFEEYLKSIKQ